MSSPLSFSVVRDPSDFLAKSLHIENMIKKPLVFLCNEKTDFNPLKLFE